MAGYDPNCVPHLQSILQSLMGIFGESLSVIVPTADGGAHANLASQLEADLVVLSLHDLSCGVEATISRSAVTGHDLSPRRGQFFSH